MDMIERYRVTVEQQKAVRDFIKTMNPVDYKISMFATSLEAEINKNEHMLNTLKQGKVGAHRCDFCDRAYDEEPPHTIDQLMICPICRVRGRDFQLGSVLEELYGLPNGTIKRDCLPKDGKPPKLQKYINAGLIYKSGVYYLVHTKVLDLYYNNPDIYRRRSSRGKAT